MRDALLSRLPAHAHPLVLAEDPDGLLDDYALRDALAARGFRLVCTEDILRLWPPA